jgi:Flp pilus assembly protein TadB
VRGEIEKLEGRRKFLENQTSLSTVTISIRTPEVFAAGSTGFFSEVWRAVSDGVNAALAIILGLIRVVLALLPLLILFGLPIYFLVRYLRRKTRREKLAAQFAEEKH